jgi:hypothetical protein
VIDQWHPAGLFYALADLRASGYSPFGRTDDESGAELNRNGSDSGSGNSTDAALDTGDGSESTDCGGGERSDGDRGTCAEHAKTIQSLEASLESAADEMGE